MPSKMDRIFINLCICKYRVKLVTHATVYSLGINRESVLLIWNPQQKPQGYKPQFFLSAGGRSYITKNLEMWVFLKQNKKLLVWTLTGIEIIQELKLKCESKNLVLTVTEINFITEISLLVINNMIIWETIVQVTWSLICYRYFTGNIHADHSRRRSDSWESNCVYRY